MSWQRNASGATTLSHVVGRACLDTIEANSVTFGIWIIICDLVLYPDRRDFSMITTTLNSSSLSPSIKHNKFAHLSTGAPINYNFEVKREGAVFNLYGTTNEMVNYSVYRFWSNQSYDDPELVEGIYGSSQTTPQVVIDNFGRLVDIKEVIITPEWGNILGKPTTVALSGLVDALSTSSTLDCGSF